MRLFWIITDYILTQFYIYIYIYLVTAGLLHQHLQCHTCTRRTHHLGSISWTAYLHCLRQVLLPVATGRPLLPIVLE